MDTLADPPIRTAALGDALGIPTFQLRLWLRRAGQTRPAPARGGVPLLEALAGILAAIRAEATEARAFRAPPLPKPGERLDEMLAALTADLARIAEGRVGGTTAEEVERLVNRLPAHRRKAMRGARQ